jgi:hypothetical protein
VLGRRPGLTVTDELFGVAGDAERRLRNVRIAEHADASPGRNLPAGKGLRNLRGTDAFDHDLLELDLARLLLSDGWHARKRKACNNDRRRAHR